MCSSTQLDDIGYVQQNRDEMEVLFTFLAERYERRTVIITSNLVFSEWDRIFKDPMTTAAAIDRLVHHSIILEMTGKSIRGCTSRADPSRRRITDDNYSDNYANLNHRHGKGANDNHSADDHPEPRSNTNDNYRHAADHRKERERSSNDDYRIEKQEP